MRYIPPVFKQQQFNCPICSVYAKQSWSDLTYTFYGRVEKIDYMLVAYCHHCLEKTFWYKGNMIIPSSGNVELPNADMPEDCKHDYLEAREIVNLSPRGAAALLRLCIQKLMKELGQSGENINSDIKELVKLGLPMLIQQSLDICRVVGNNAVHPGEIDLNDTPEIAHTMFKLINVIVQDRITKPKEIQNLFDSLPEGAKEAIKKRDNN